MVIELKYSGTNTYIVLGGRMAESFLMRGGQVLFHSFAGCLARRGDSAGNSVFVYFPFLPGPHGNRTGNCRLWRENRGG